MTKVDTGYVDLPVQHTPAKPRNAEVLADLTELLAALSALVMQYEEEIQPDLALSPRGTLQYLIEEHGLQQVDSVPILGTK